VEIKQTKFIFYLTVSLEIFFVCILGIVSVMLYLISVKSAFSLTFDNIKPYFITVTVATVLFIVMVFVLIWFIAISEKQIKMKLNMK
jgi:hypothetical protein